MMAKKKSPCSSCGGMINRGEYVMYRPALGAWHPECPEPSLRANAKPGVCSQCQSPVEAGEGILAPRSSGRGYDVCCRACA